MMRIDKPVRREHTPGPWRWHGYYLMQDCPRISEPSILFPSENSDKEANPYSTPCGYPIACDGSAGGEYGATIDIAGPDARLIAAAPDLLEALETMIECYVTPTLKRSDYKLTRKQAAALALKAIAKAKGTQ